MQKAPISICPSASLPASPISLSAAEMSEQNLNQLDASVGDDDDEDEIADQDRLNSVKSLIYDAYRI